jgi:hypothetical protein
LSILRTNPFAPFDDCILASPDDNLAKCNLNCYLSPFPALFLVPAFDSF